MKRKAAFLIWLVLSFPVYAAEGWQRVYTDAAKAYLYDASVEDLAVAALKGLKNVDKNLTLGNDGQRLSLYYRGKPVKVGHKPQDKNDAYSWGKLTDEIVAGAVEKSPKANERDFEINEIMAAALADVLDKDSKFYSDIDEANGITKYSHRRQFAARMEGDILYLKIGAFNKQTFDEIKQAIEDFKQAEALVIDLQGCPGGLAGEAVKIAGLFLDGGIITSAKGRDEREETYYNADDGDIFERKPVFVFTDAVTASAAEILAAALQEQGRAKIIGTLTKGKGTMQELIGISGGGVLAVTSGYFMTPSGRKLNGAGVVPDVCTFEMPPLKNVENLLKEQNGSCNAEIREDNRLELSVVQNLLKK